MAYDFSKFDPRKHGDSGNAMGQKDIDHLKGQGASDYEISQYIRDFGGTVGGAARSYEQKHTKDPNAAPRADSRQMDQWALSTAEKDKGGGETESGTTDGMFGFQDIMNQFYGYEPTKEDDTGRATKLAFQGNMIQSAFEAQQAKEMAYTNQEIATGAMGTAADLELRNQSQIMADEFKYASKFAAVQGEQNRMQIGASGEQDRLTVGESGRQDRLGAVTAGEQDRLGIQTTGSEQRKGMETQGQVDVRKTEAAGTEARKTVGAQGQVDVEKIGVTGAEERKNIEATGQANLAQIGAQGEVDISKIGAGSIAKQAEIGAAGIEQRAAIGAQGDVDVSKLRVGGEEQRAGMQEEGRQKAITAARDHKYSRSLATMT